MEQMVADEKPKKIIPGSVPLLAAGELLFARSPDREMSQLFKRYEALLETFANMDKEERIINYKFLVGLMLTSHAKKCHDLPKRKALFELKNELFLNVANNKAYRKKIAFKYLKSKNFRLVSSCDRCQKENEKNQVPLHKRKFCKKCEVDRTFFNILSMHHKFKSGSATLFLSQDQIHKVENLRKTPSGKLEKAKEQAQFEKYLYNVKNLDIFDLETVKAAQKMLLKN